MVVCWQRTIWSDRYNWKSRTESMASDRRPFYFVSTLTLTSVSFCVSSVNSALCVLRWYHRTGYSCRFDVVISCWFLVLASSHMIAFFSFSFRQALSILSAYFFFTLLLFIPLQSDSIRTQTNAHAFALVQFHTRTHAFVSKNVLEGHQSFRSIILNANQAQVRPIINEYACVCLLE